METVHVHSTIVQVCLINIIITGNVVHTLFKQKYISKAISTTQYLDFSHIIGLTLGYIVR